MSELPGPGSRIPDPGNDRQFSTNDCPQSGLLRRLVKARGAIDAVGIEQCQRRIAQRSRAFDERFGERCALQKAESRGRMKLDVRHEIDF